MHAAVAFKGWQNISGLYRVQRMSSTEHDASVYARLRLAPFIKEAVQAAVVARPADTIDFMIQFLTKNKDKLQVCQPCRHKFNFFSFSFLRPLLGFFSAARLDCRSG